jgi:hypothetical protein
LVVLFVVRQPDVEVAVVNTGPPVPVRVLWADGTHIATMNVPAGTHIPRSLEIEHDPSEVAKAADAPTE